jgi:hypothetical protein
MELRQGFVCLKEGKEERRWELGTSERPVKACFLEVKRTLWPSLSVEGRNFIGVRPHEKPYKQAVFSPDLVSAAAEKKVFVLWKCSQMPIFICWLEIKVR